MLTALLLCSLGLAAPPSSTLSGPEGELKWTVTESADEVRIEGSSPKWTVTHVANADLTPKRTERVDAVGTRVTIDYTAQGATVHLPDKTVERGQPELWDGDTLDIRLGHEVARGHTELEFHGVDVATGKVYRFDTKKVGEEQCGDQPCTHLLVQLTGVLRYVGPSWNYWYGADGRLLRFEGPAGTFTANQP